MRVDYGQDAPGVRLGMLGIVAVGVALLVGARASGSSWPVPVGVVALLYGASMSAYMTWSSRVGKTRARDRLLDHVARVRPWGGDEIVIDVGCGSGLLLIGAAKRLDGGTAIGFDVWRAKDLSANSADTARANAEAEGVAERVRIETGDARSLPLGDAGVDVVLSHWVLHNLDPSGDRVKALDEMWRVLRPGGVLLVADIAFVADYVAYLRSLGAVRCEFLDGGREARIMGLLSGGTYRPQARICRKPSGETATGSVEAACASR